VVILDLQGSLADIVSHRIAQRLDRPEAAYATIRQAFDACLARDPGVAEAFRADIAAVLERDPACTRLIGPALYFKGFHALQTHRLAHWLWRNGRSDFALVLQSLASQIFQTDIHPAARIGKGVFFDHAPGVVIGEPRVTRGRGSAPPWHHARRPRPHPPRPPTPESASRTCQGRGGGGRGAAAGRG